MDYIYHCMHVRALHRRAASVRPFIVLFAVRVPFPVPIFPLESFPVLILMSLCVQVLRRKVSPESCNIVHVTVGGDGA